MQLDILNGHTPIYPANFESFEDETEWVVTLPDWPEVAAGGETLQEALEDAFSALEEAALYRLAHGQELPSPSPMKGLVLPLQLPPFATLKWALHAWEKEQGRGARSTLARTLGVDAKTVRQILAPELGKVSMDRLIQTARAAGLQATLTLQRAMDKAS